jgi:hypothetical protein
MPLFDPPGGGVISSVFGRTGVVTAESGDYTAAQVGADAAGAAAAAQAAAEAASLPTLTEVSVSAAGTLALNKITEVTATSGLVTMTLPASVAGSLIVCERSGASTSNVAVTGNIRGVSAQTITLELASESEMFFGDGTTWWPAAGHKTLSSLQALFLQAANNLSDVASPSTALANLGGAPGLRLVYVDAHGADPTGATYSDTAFAAAQAAAGSGAYQMVMGSGTYKLAGAYTFGRYQGLTGPGSAFCTISYTGTGTCIAAYDSSFNSSESFGGKFGGFAINGAGAGSAAVGMSWGNLGAARCNDITIVNFTGASSIGLDLHNGSGWSEEGEWTAIRLVSNTVNVCYDTGSFDYSLFQFVIVAEVNQNGVQLQNSCALEGVRFELRGNFIGGAGNTGCVFAIDPGNPSGASRIDKAQMYVSVESDGTGTGHYTVQMGGGSSSQFNGTGVLHFLNGGEGAPPFQAGTFVGTYGFSGIIDETGLGDMVNGDSAAFWGGTQWNVRGSLTGGWGGTLYTQYADVQCLQLSSGSNAWAFANVPAIRARRMELLIAQPASGGAGTITWPGSVTWQSASPPVLQTANGAVDRIRFTYLPATSTWYGEYIGLDQSSADITANGTLALGATGKGADAGHVHPSLVAVSAQDRGYLAMNGYPEYLGGALTPVAGTIYLAGILVRQPITVAHVTVFVQSPEASGVTANENFIGLYNAAGTRLAQTATDSAYTSATYTPVPVALSAGAITPGLYWVAWLMNASAMPELSKVGGGVSSAMSNVGLSPVLYATGGALQTSLPASGLTPAAASTVPWVALS